MKLNHLLRKALFRSRMDGIKNMLRELIYLNRTMIVIEKNILESRLVQCDDIRFVVVDHSNLKDFNEKRCAQLVKHYCRRGASCVLAYRGEKILGYQFYCRDNSFSDLVKIGLRIGKEEAYLFDLFVFPEYRGSDVPQKITSGTFRHLMSEGIRKIYGFYFADNIRSLWWHRAVLKCREVKRIKAHRLLLLEWANGKFALNF